MHHSVTIAFQTLEICHILNQDFYKDIKGNTSGKGLNVRISLCVVQFWKSLFWEEESFVIINIMDFFLWGKYFYFIKAKNQTSPLRIPELYKVARIGEMVFYKNVMLLEKCSSCLSDTYRKLFTYNKYEYVCTKGKIKAFPKHHLLCNMRIPTAYIHRCPIEADSNLSSGFLAQLL